MTDRIPFQSLSPQAKAELSSPLRMMVVPEFFQEFAYWMDSVDYAQCHLYGAAIVNGKLTTRTQTAYHNMRDNMLAREFFKDKGVELVCPSPFRKGDGRLTAQDAEKSMMYA